MLPPITHALPAKPVLAPPPVEEPTGIRAKPMNNGRHRKVNGSGSAPMASDGNDLPPYWETKYSSSGDVFYYNTKSKETTWIFPSSGRSSPTKARETSGVHGATRRSLEPRDDTWSDRSGRGHHARSAHREHTSHRQSSPPRHPDSSIPARHYRTDNNSASVSDRHASRGGMPYSHDPSYVQARSTSPSATDGRRVARSVSPHWGRRGRRDQSPASTSQNRGGWRETQRGYPQDRSAGGSDSSWTRSQDYAAPSRSLARSPSGLRSRRQEDMEQPFRRKDEFEPRIRRKDDIEPPIRRKDDIEPPIRRKDDIEPPIHRRDNFDQPSRRWGDVEPPLRRRDDFEPNVRRKDDIEPPIRRKDDIEPPIRRRDEVDPHSRRQDDIDARIRRKDDIEPPLRLPASSRHLNDEWSAPSTLFASSARLSPPCSSRGGRHMRFDCLVTPRELIFLPPFLARLPSDSCTYEDNSADPGSLDSLSSLSRFVVPLAPIASYTNPFPFLLQDLAHRHRFRICASPRDQSAPDIQLPQHQLCMEPQL